MQKVEIIFPFLLFNRGGRQSTCDQTLQEYECPAMGRAGYQDLLYWDCNQVRKSTSNPAPSGPGVSVYGDRSPLRKFSKTLIKCLAVRKGIPFRTRETHSKQLSVKLKNLFTNIFANRLTFANNFDKIKAPHQEGVADGKSYLLLCQSVQ